MNAIVPFSFESTQIRSILQNGEPWFVGADVCRALGLSNPSLGLSRLDEDEKNTLCITEGIRGNPNKIVINEPGVYRLIFTSRRPEAERFKRWLAHEVLPEMRRTGSYRPRRRQVALPPALLSDLFAIFGDHNRGSVWSEYVALADLERVFPDANPRELRRCMKKLAFLPMPYHYHGVVSFIRYHGDCDSGVVIPLRWIHDGEKWFYDVAPLLENPPSKLVVEYFANHAWLQEQLLLG